MGASGGVSLQAAKVGKAVRADKVHQQRRSERRARPRTANRSLRSVAPNSLRVVDGGFADAIASGAVAEAEVRLQRRIRAHLSCGQLEVTLTDNRYTMISVRRRERVYRVRMHHMFADAGPRGGPSSGPLHCR